MPARAKASGTRTHNPPAASNYLTTTPSPPQALPGQCRFQPLDASKVGLAVGTSPRRKGGETIRHQARPGSLPAQLRARTPNTPPKSLPKAFSAIRPTAPFRQNCPTSRLAVVPGACILKHFCREPSGAPACGAERWLAGSGGCGRSRRRRRRPRGRRERRPEGPKLTPDEQQGRRPRRPEGPSGLRTKLAAPRACQPVRASRPVRNGGSRQKCFRMQAPGTTANRLVGQLYWGCGPNC